MEQNWYQSDSMIEVEIDCVVHAVPEPEVHSFLSTTVLPG